MREISPKLSRTQSGAKIAAPPGRVCTNAVSAAARSSASLVRYITASCTSTASNVRPSRSVRMSPRACSQSGFSARLSACIGSEMSVSVQRRRRLRKNALLPAPAPSSSSVWPRGAMARSNAAW
jgi:hypothetical protein